MRKYLLAALLGVILAFPISNHAQVGGSGTGSGGGGGTPASPTTSIQFNNSGSFGGDANLKWIAGAGNGLQIATPSLVIGTTFAAIGDPVDPGSLLIGPGAYGDVGNPLVQVETLSGDELVEDVIELAPHAEFNLDRAGSIEGTYMTLNTYQNSGTTNSASIRSLYTRISALGADGFYTGDINALWADMTVWRPVTTSHSLYLATPLVQFSGSIATHEAIFVGDLAGIATNPYYSWFDSRGVGRCKEDSAFDSVGQSICTVYNPQFTKYTPGLANYERIIYGEWSGNVGKIGIEAGGTGTLRNLQLMGATLIVPVTVTSGTVPGVANVGANSCGTTAATILGNDNAFEITVGATAGTQCRVAFTTTAPTRRECTVTDSTTTIATRATYVDTTHTDFFGAFVAGDIVTGVCFAR